MYFRNKEDIFAAALEALGEQTIQVVRDAHATATGPLPQIRAAVEALFLFLAGNPRQARIMVVESSGLSPRLEQVRRKILKWHAAEVRQIMEGPGWMFAPTDAAIGASCLVGAVCESLYTWLDSPESERLPADSVARAVADYNVRALSNTGA